MCCIFIREFHLLIIKNNINELCATKIALLMVFIEHQNNAVKMSTITKQ